jgi:hypothetical protein
LVKLGNIDTLIKASKREREGVKGSLSKRRVRIIKIERSNGAPSSTRWRN